MPLYPKSPAQTWANESPSVLESPVERGLRSATKWIGMGDDESGGVMDAVNPMEVVGGPLISIYRNVADRMAGTQNFLKSTLGHGPAVTAAAEALARSHPRIAAHMKMMHPAHPRIASALAKAPNATAAVLVPNDRIVKEPLPMMTTQLGRAVMNNDPQKALDIMYHEATHTAQALGQGKDASRLYNLASKIAGYVDNPYEISARVAGSRQGRMHDIPNYSAIKGLWDLALDTQKIGTNRPMSDTLNGIEIEKTLVRRGAK